MKVNFFLKRYFSFFLYIFIIFNKMDSSNSQKGSIKLSQPWMGQEVSEGDGVTVFRVLGINKASDIDPFLMMDHFVGSKLPGGFPDHPHRGFETVTYLTEGKILHEDFKGHKGEISEGDIQWMTAGKGIVHAEMPYSYTKPTSGFQLWINLSSENKMKDPTYQEIRKEKIPVYSDPNGKYKIVTIAGKVGDVEGPCKSTTPTSYLDITLEPNSECVVPIPEDSSGMVFLFQGEAMKVNDKTLKKMWAVRLDSEKESEMVFNTGKDKCRLLLIFAKPLRQPIAKYGPFVMNTQEEIQQAFMDYKLAQNGFENRRSWESKIQYMTQSGKDEF
jgi:quercetin 2,3-dioxygenase